MELDRVGSWFLPKLQNEVSFYQCHSNDTPKIKDSTCHECSTHDRYWSLIYFLWISLSMRATHVPLQSMLVPGYGVVLNTRPVFFITLQYQTVIQFNIAISVLLPTHRGYAALDSSRSLSLSLSSYD